MKITIYELLGLVKDGKAPKKIAYNSVKLEYAEGNEDYYSYYGRGLFEYKFTTCNDFLNDEVEIIEEPKKMKKIEMVGCNVRVPALNNEIVGTDTPLALETAIVKVNELIDEVNKLKEGKL